jgi:hypothetical protein
MRPANPRKCADEPIVSFDHAGVREQPVLTGRMEKKSRDRQAAEFHSGCDETRRASFRQMRGEEARIDLPGYRGAHRPPCNPDW